jgi:hypothetical protein
MNEQERILLRVLGPMSATALNKVSSALPPETCFRQAGTVAHDGRECAVFEFFVLLTDNQEEEE